MASTSVKRVSDDFEENSAAKKMKKSNEDVAVSYRNWYDNNMRSYTFKNQDQNNLNLNDFYNSVRNIIENKISDFLINEGSLKFDLSLSILFTRNNSNDEIYYNNASLDSEKIDLTYSKIRKINNILNEIFSHITTQCEEWQEKDSQWAINRILEMELNLYKYDPLNGGRYINLPLSINKKNACLNIKNNDDFCFKYCILANFVKVDNPSRVSSYSSFDISNNIFDLNVFNKNIVLDFSGLSFPLALNKITRFEKKNQSISINVFGIDAKGKNIIGPLYKTEELKANHINLIYLNNENSSHYVLINNLSRLVRSQISSYEHRMFICDFCLIHFSDEISYKLHKRVKCSEIVTKMPSEENKFVEFKDFQKQLKCPFAIYADFETMMTPFLTYDNDPQQPSSNDINIHTPISYSYLIKCSFNPHLDKIVKYSQNNITNTEDCVDHFVRNLYEDCIRLYQNHICVPQDMIFTDDDLRNFSNQTSCHICGNLLNNDRVRDHCHLTGKFNGYAHNKCNLLYRVPQFFPIFFHNLSRFDAHLFVTALNKFDKNTLTVIPQTKENYISIIKNIAVPNIKKFKTIQLRFIDTFRFLPSSLESLANTLQTHQFRNLSKFFPNFQNLNIYRKGVFPYEWLTCHAKLLETRLPPRSAFYSILKNKRCSFRDYRFARSLWKKLNCKTFEEFMLAYVETDALLLADIFENFRDVCLKDYKLDPCYYFTAPGLSWDAMLKFTKVKLELLTDVNIYNFFKKGIRGGLTQCSIRHVQASNKYIKGETSRSISHSCSDIQNPSFLVDLDANNLYGSSMVSSLPYADFNWISEQELRQFTVEKILNLGDDSDMGYVFEVDLSYPKSLHDLHNDFACCPENRIPPNGKHTKLMATLHDKKGYIIHYRHLKLVLSLGLVLKKIHRVLSFKQSKWLESYISFNTNQRAQATFDFHKDFYKLMNNAIYGKTMENIEKRRDVKIVLSWNNHYRRKGAREYIASPFFHSIANFDNNTSAIQLKKSLLVYDKPIYAGFSILEESKTKMYSFHYNYMKPKFGVNVHLVYTDTDSFIYHIQTPDFYNDIRDDLNDYFDTSNYELDNEYGFPLVNKKKIGFFKDENAGKIMTEFVGLKAKMYSFTIQNSIYRMRAKGIPSLSIKHLTIKDFKNCIYHNVEYFANFRAFRSRLHKIYTINVTKLALNNKDDKRYILRDGIHTLAWGHYRINNYT